MTTRPPVDSASVPLLDLSAAVPKGRHGVKVLVRDEAAGTSGSHKESAARAVVARAIRDGHRHITVGTCGNYGRAMAVACRDAKVACTVALTEGWSDGGEWMRRMGADVVLVPGGYEDAVEASRKLAEELDAADGNVDGPYVTEVFAGHGEVVRTLPAAAAGLWVPIGNGTTAVAVHRALRSLGRSAAVHGVGSAGNNPIVTSWPGEYRPLLPDEPRATAHNEPLVNWHALHGPEAMAAVAASGGAVHGVDDSELLRARKLLADHGVSASPSGAVAFAGFLEHAADLDGTHMVLVTGRV